MDLNAEAPGGDTGTAPPHSAPPDMPRADGSGDYQKVEAERMDDAPGGGGPRGGAQPLPPAAPPRLAACICLFLAWLFLGSSLPFTVLAGLPLNLAALALGIICLTRGAGVTALLILLLGTFGSFAVYLFGLASFIGGALPG